MCEYLFKNVTMFAHCANIVTPEIENRDRDKSIEKEIEIDLTVPDGTVRQPRFYEADELTPLFAAKPSEALLAAQKRNGIVSSGRTRSPILRPPAARQGHSYG